MFRWSKNTKDWAETLLDNKKNSVIKIDFDLYYLFLLIGLGLGRSEVLDENDLDELSAEDPKDGNQEPEKGSKSKTHDYVVKIN